MADTKESVTKNVKDSEKGVDGATAVAEGTTTNALERTTGGLGAFVGMLTTGIVIAAAAGFGVGLVTGVAVARLAPRRRG